MLIQTKAFLTLSFPNPRTVFQCTIRKYFIIAVSNDWVHIKKVRINAQVTAIISVLEIVFMMTSVMIVGLLTRANTAGTRRETIINGLSVYFILLPRAFLMNTSHNKNRIVEYGWKNVFMNFLGIANKQSKATLENQSNTASNKFESINVSKELKVENVESIEMSSTSALGSQDSNSDLESPGPSNTSRPKPNYLLSTSIGNDSSSTLKQSNENEDGHEIRTLKVNQSMIEDANNIILESYFSNRTQYNTTNRKN